MNKTNVAQEKLLKHEEQNKGVELWVILEYYPKFYAFIAFQEKQSLFLIHTWQRL